MLLPMRTLLPLLFLLGCPGTTPVESGDTDTTHDSGDTSDTSDTSDTDCVDCAACADAGYAHLIEGKSGSELKSVLQSAVDGLYCDDYGAATTWMFLELDNVAGKVECVYTGRITTAVDSKPDANTDMNTEHTWPRSLGAQENPAKCDVNHLFPSDSNANSKRGNLPLGEVVAGTEWQEGGSKQGLDDDGEMVFEPRDAHKGNAARALFYFQLQYPENTSGSRLSDAEIALYREWHQNDPPDAAEEARALAIADKQGRANPYVVCPHLVEAVPH